MLELADHILDIGENSVRAGAKLVNINVTEDSIQNLLTIEIEDDGRGMNKDEIKKALDPFYTTKKVRRVGLGLPMLASAAELAGGKLNLTSEPGRGTRLTSTFELTHFDRQPLGNITNSLIILIAGNSTVDFFYKHRHNDRQFELDTRQIRKEIDDLPINHPEILKYIRGVIEEGFRDIEPDA